MSILAFTLVALGSSAATLVRVLLVANLTSSEKQIQYQVEHLYGVDDPQFARSVGGCWDRGYSAGTG